MFVIKCSVSSVKAVFTPSTITKLLPQLPLNGRNLHILTWNQFTHIIHVTHSQIGEIDGHRLIKWSHIWLFMGMGESTHKNYCFRLLMKMLVFVKLSRPPYVVVRAYIYGQFQGIVSCIVWNQHNGECDDSLTHTHTQHKQWCTHMHQNEDTPSHTHTQ